MYVCVRVRRQNNNKKKKKKCFPLNLLSVLTIPSGACCRVCRCLAVPMATTRWVDRLGKHGEELVTPSTRSGRTDTQIRDELPHLFQPAGTLCSHQKAAETESMQADDQSDSLPLYHCDTHTHTRTHGHTRCYRVHKKRRLMPCRSGAAREMCHNR